MCNIVNLVFVNKIFFDDPRGLWDDFINPTTVLNCFDARNNEMQIAFRGFKPTAQCDPLLYGLYDDELVHPSSLLPSGTRKERTTWPVEVEEHVYDDQISIACKKQVISTDPK